MTKPSVYELADKWDRVLIRLSNGRLAGLKKFNHCGDSEYVGVVEKEQWHQDWELDNDNYAHTISLWKAYGRESYSHIFDIDAIAFLNNASEVTDALEFGCVDDIDWDWDIDNPHNLKFKKGDVVVIDHAENRSAYVRMLGKVGTIVDAEYTSYIDDERITYRVRVDDSPNEYQENGLWVFHDESSLELYNPQCDDQMDDYEYVIQKLGLNNNPHNRDYIIKGDNRTMNNILDIYGDRKREKINKHYEQLMELTKLADERYAIFKDCSDKLDKLYKEDRVITHSLVEPKLAETTLKHLEQLAKFREEEYCKLENLLREVHAQLSMCETYEQKQNVLNTYKILKANGKVNA